MGQLADAAVPFGGLLMKLFKGAADFAKDRKDGARNVEQAEDAANKTLVDEVCECMHALVHGAGGLPAVLWLDDAQWIDEETQEFVRRIWATAQRHRWPLLLVVTHWEREWRELGKAGNAADASPLLAMQGDPGVEVRVLAPSQPDALDSYLRTRLPGLTAPQRALLLEKAAGNFLTMVENVGQLLRVPQNFVDRDVAKPLAPAGERLVQKWESERQKRVEQRFSELAPDLQEMLGWGSHLGMSFLREVIEEFAERVAGQPGAADRMREAVDPLVILGEPSDHLREFRDRAFHHVARRHFEEYGSEHAEALDQVLRERLVDWVNNSFDETGDEIWPNDEKGISVPPRAITGLSNEEARDVLGMAVAYLPLHVKADWSDSAQMAALRARYLLAIVDWREKLWDRVRQSCRGLESVDWNQLPMGALAIRNIYWLADQAETAGALRAALGMWMRLLAVDREAAELGTPESRRDVSISLERVADIEEARGDLDGALARYKEGLEIRRALMAEFGTPNCRLNLSVSLEKVASIEQARGDLDGALARYEEGLEIRRALMAELGTPASRRNMSWSLSHVASNEQARGDLDGALARYKEGLEIRRALMAELGTPESRRDVSFALLQVATIEHERGDLDGALARYEEGLEIALALMAELGTPHSHGYVSMLLEFIADIDKSRGDLDGALAGYEEGLEINRAMMAELGTPQSRRDVSCSLEKIARIDQSRGDLDGALAGYEEGLEIRRALMAEFGTHNCRLNLSVSLNNVAGIEQARGDLEGALARYEEGLQILLELMAEFGTTESRRNASWSLTQVASIKEMRGDLEGALARYEEGLEIRRALMAELGTPESRCDVSVSLDRVADIERARGDLDGALARYEEGLEIRRALMAELGTPESRRNVSFSLHNVADIEQARGDLDGALARYEEGLAINRALMAELGTPESRRDVSVRLLQVASIKEMCGDLDGALARYEESLKIDRGLIAGLESPDNCYCMIISLECIASIEQARGDLDGALAHYEESLEIRRRSEELATPDSLNDLVSSTQLCAGVEISLSRAGAAIVRLESLVAQVSLLESASDVNTLDTVAAYWERRTEALDALGRSAEATESRTRALAIRTRIAEIVTE
jgi:tetratricopeptide (TPR) repeat protein